jgi:hypothetical protein
MDVTETRTCPVCGGTELVPCLRIPRVPVFCNVLLDTPEAALAAPTGTLDLRFCPGCGHLHNAAFDPRLVAYSADYENSLHHSPRFQDYTRSLAAALHARHRLTGKTVAEIASGQGDFLRELVDCAGCRGIGFDPAYRGPSGERDGVEIIPEHYSDYHARRAADLILCRHALEHIAQPAEFVRMVRRAIGSRPTAVYFEVPDARFTLRDLGVWDLIYEHCGYFTRESLARVFRDAGFRVDGVEETFGGQFLGLHGRASDAGSQGSAADLVGKDDLEGLATLVADFQRAYDAKVAHWESELGALARAGGRAVVWGAGSKGVSLVNTVSGSGSGAIAALVDINPLKQGRFAPGTGHPVVAPGALTGLRPDRVLVLNPQYRDEIAAKLRGLGVRAELLVDAAP